MSSGGDMMKKNNKGAALISVLIATAFLAITATALLMISYSNYKMKVVNLNSKNNFYESEKNLNVISASVRSTVKGSTSPDTDLETKIGVTTVGTNKSYNMSNLVKLVYPSYTGTSKNNATVLVGNADGTYDMFTFSTNGSNNYSIGDALDTSGNVISGIKEIKIKDINVRQQSNYRTEPNPSGAGNITKYDYDNTIKTDIVIRYEESVSGGASSGVGDFSFISDSSISVQASTSMGTTLYIYGNAFFSNLGNPAVSTIDSVDYWETEPNGTALSLGTNNKVTCLGDYIISYGDIILNNNAVLVVDTDNFYCYGDIKLNDTSALLCKGKIHMLSGKTIQTNSTTRNNVYPASLIHPTSSSVIRVSDDDYRDFQESIGCLDLKTAFTSSGEAKKNDGILPQICKRNIQNTNNSGSFTWYTDVKNNMDAMSNTWTSPSDGFTYNVSLVQNTPCNGSCKYCLGFVMPKNNSYSFEEQNICSTWLSVKPISFSMNHDIVLTKMGNDAFRELTDMGKTSKTRKVRIGDSTTNDVYYIQDMFVANPDAAIQNIINSATGGGGGAATPAQTSVTYSSWSKDE